MMLARALRVAVLGSAVGCTNVASTGSTRPAAFAAEGPAASEPAPTGAARPGAATPSGVLGMDHVGLTVTDLERSKDLFVEVLGFRVRGQDARHPSYFLTNDATTITLWRASDPATAVPFDRHRNVGLHHLALAVASFEELDALHERLAGYEGAVIELAPEPAYGGPAKHMMFREPSGDRIELVHRPSP